MCMMLLLQKKRLTIGLINRSSALILIQWHESVRPVLNSCDSCHASSSQAER
jgi:hypothetical protein